LIFKASTSGIRHAPQWRMTPKDLKDRTNRFAIECIKLCRTLPTTVDGRRVGQQLIDSSTSVAANYRAACRGRSRAEFIAKLGTVLEESDESLFWLELMVDSGLIAKSRAEALLKEADELTAIFTTSLKTAKSNPNPYFKK
jgi:four helix bundle protein